MPVCSARTYQLQSCNSWKQLGTAALNLLVISVEYTRELTSAMYWQVVVGPKALMHPDVEEALPGTTYNALTRRAGWHY